jgi:tRNA(His) 5'-end guanylyltransferase
VRTVKGTHKPKKRTTVAYERFADTHIEPGVFFAVRADGHHFHEVTRDMKKPYDERFRALMSQAIRTYVLRRDCLPFMAFTFSDEVSFVFRSDDDVYSRRIEKLDSLVASALSAILTKTMRRVAFFDARVVVLPRLRDVIRYLAERQNEARRDCINGHTFYTLVQGGLTHEQAGEAMRNWRFLRMSRYLRQNKIVFGKLPPWQRRGEAIHWKAYRRSGFNPVTRKRTVAVRYGLVRNDTLPYFASESGRRLVRKALVARRGVAAPH